MTQNPFMQKAIALSLENVTSGRGGPFGAVVVKNGKIIGEGTNLVTHSHDPSAHAEITALRAACMKLNHFHLTDCDLYASCEPCPMCLAAANWAHIRKIYYAGTKEDVAKIGFDDAAIFKKMGIPLGHKLPNMAQIMHDEALKAYDMWVKTEKKIEY